MGLRRQVLGYFAGVALAAASPFAGAAMVTLEGDDFDFSFDTDDLGIYGMPTVSGNLLQFAPTDWVAKASNAVGFTDTNATLNITVTARDPLGRVETLALQERGDYRFRDRKPADGEDPPQVTVAGQIRVTVGADESTDMIEPTGPFTATFPPTMNWVAEAETDVAAWSAPSVLVTLENLLSAESYALGDTAFIEKKRVDLAVTGFFVPLPPALWMFGGALFALSLIGRRMAH